MLPLPSEDSRTPFQAGTLPRRIANKRVWIIKKVRVTGGIWKFISLEKVGKRYVWDDQPGYYFLEWWEGRKRRRERAGETPSQALEAQRRKTNELIGEMAGSARSVKPVEEGGMATSIERAIVLFQEHINAHSPTKPATLQRYNQVLDHFARILGNKKYVEAVTRSGIDDYKIARRRETVGNDRRPVSAATINFEITVLRTLFYYLIRERCISMDNPCARFKPLRSDKERLKRRLPVYGQAELDKIIAESGHIERAIFATLVLTGLCKDELCALPPFSVPIIM